jgi:hypothetical protein
MLSDPVIFFTASAARFIAAGGLEEWWKDRLAEKVNAD